LNLYERSTKVQAALVKLARIVADNTLINGVFEGDPGIKKVGRCSEKMVLKAFETLGCKLASEESQKKLTYMTLKDLSRVGILVRDLNNIYWALNKLSDAEKWFKTKVKIVRIKNRFADKQSDLGYRDILLNVVFPDIDPDYIAEFQIHHSKFHEIRAEGSGHQNYTAARFLIDFVMLVSKNTEKDKGAPMILQKSVEKLIKM